MKMNILAKNILALEKSSLSKVRFAKTIYFVHKELIRNNLANKEDFKYIRMPLGPVPDGFMQLTSIDNEIKSERVKNIRLAYESIEYSTEAEFKGSDEERNVIEKTLKTLRDHNTSSLVNASHEDSSWKENKNGVLYYVTDLDMKNDLSMLCAAVNANNDSDNMQASLVRGMLQDIVSESTGLEYPD